MWCCYPGEIQTNKQWTSHTLFSWWSMSCHSRQVRYWQRSVECMLIEVALSWLRFAILFTELLNSSPPEKMAADDNFRGIFVNEQCCFWLKSHWSLFLGVQLTITQHWFRWWLCQAIIWAHADPIHWRIYAALGGYDLRSMSFKFVFTTNEFILKCCQLTWKYSMYYPQLLVVTQNMKKYLRYVWWFLSASGH